MNGWKAMFLPLEYKLYYSRSIKNGIGELCEYFKPKNRGLRAGVVQLRSPQSKVDDPMRHISASGEGYQEQSDSELWKTKVRELVKQLESVEKWSKDCCGQKPFG